MAAPASAQKSEEKWRAILSPEQFHILRQKGTEYPGRGEYDQFYEEGIYNCAGGDRVRHDGEKAESGDKAETAVVQFVGESQVIPQREHSVRSIREKKGKNQNKKQPKSKGVPKFSDLVSINKQEQRNIKRTRESTQLLTTIEDQQRLPGEFVNEDVMELQLGTSTLHQNSKEELIVFGEEGKEGPDADALLEEEGNCFLSNPHDPGAFNPIDGPSGRFWVGPESSVAESEMVVETPLGQQKSKREF
ncbi:hypothetical protein K1719_018541 [Acacia pycnantha]|nr:hypothetical protein K1719_018541 [Acacia pycnantha]